MTGHANSSVNAAIMLKEIEFSAPEFNVEKTEGHRAVHQLGSQKFTRAGEMLVELIELARRSAPTVLAIALRIFR